MASVSSGTIVAVSSSFTDRLNERIALLKAEGRFSLNKLNDAAGLSTGYLSRLVKGERKMPGIELVEPIAAALRVRLDWLQRGVGEVELPADPPEWAPLPETARVALRVASGRGQDVAAAFRAIRDMPRGSSFEQYIAVAEGRSVAEPIELPAEFHRALGWLEAKHGRDFTAAAFDLFRGAAHRARRTSVEELAMQIYELAQESKGKSEFQRHRVEAVEEAPRVESKASRSRLK